MREDDLLNRLSCSRLPSSWRWTAETIAVVTERNLCALAISMASVVDAVLHGCNVVSIRQELDAPWNYLDHLQDKFEILRPISKERIPEKLSGIFFHNGNITIENLGK